MFRTMAKVFIGFTLIRMLLGAVKDKNPAPAHRPARPAPRPSRA